MCKDIRLVESVGEILLVADLCTEFVRSGAASFKEFRPDASTSSWVEMEWIGNRVLFLGNNCSASFTATELGFKENQIYFTAPNTPHAGWYVYDMEEGSFSKTKYDRVSNMKSPMWITPSFV